MTTLRKRRKLAAISRETPEYTRNNQSQNTFIPGMAEDITQVSGEIKGKSLKNFPSDFSRTESRILGALSKLDEFLLNPQVRTCSVAVPGTSRNNNSENRELTGDRSLDDSCPELVFSACHTTNLNDPEQEETQHRSFEKKTVGTLHALSNRKPLIEENFFACHFISKSSNFLCNNKI